MAMEDRKYFVIPEGTETHRDYERWTTADGLLREQWFDWAFRYGHKTVVVCDGRLLGLPADGPCPEGWKRHRGRGDDHWYPPGNTKAGKLSRAEMSRMTRGRWVIPGAQSHIAGGLLHYPSHGEICGKLIVSVHKDSVAEIPGAVPLKLSEYARLLEQAEEAQKAKEPT